MGTGDGDLATATGVVLGEPLPLGLPHCGEQAAPKTKTAANAAVQPPFTPATYTLKLRLNYVHSIPIVAVAGPDVQLLPLVQGVWSVRTSVHTPP